MARQQRSHSIEFKRQVVQEYIAGETLYELAKRHDLSRQLIRVWVEAGGLDADAQAADLLHEYETKIVAWERMVGRQALEIEFLKGALKNAPRPRSATINPLQFAHRQLQHRRLRRHFWGRALPPVQKSDALVLSIRATTASPTGVAKLYPGNIGMQ
jgi:transposase-like protein